MERAPIRDFELEYEVAGSGEPVVFIHGAFIADAFRPFRHEEALRNHRLILYRRRGHGGTGAPAGPVGVAEQTSDCTSLMRHLGVARAHVVGHSYGGAVALQMTLDHPSMVESLTLLEPALMIGESGRDYRAALVEGAERYREAGGPGTADIVDAFFRARWARYRDGLEEMLPGAVAQAVADAPTWFEQDLPGLLDWPFGEAQARDVRRPTLSVLGGDSHLLGPRFLEAHRLLLRCVPQVEEFVLPDTTHFMQLEGPLPCRRLAEVLARFFARQPL